MTIPGVDDKKEFEEVVDALKMLNFDKDVSDSLFRLLSAVLLLGNIKFNSVSSETCEMSNESIKIVENCAELLGVDLPIFKFSLTEKMVQMGRGSVVSIKLTTSQATDSRDTLAKTLYGNMFDWVVKHVNENLKKPGETCSIGILDIFGFEVFQVNSFEQLCINYANEKLQFHFNDVIFTEEMKLYDEENVPTDKVVFEDNGRCVSLIEGKPFGLLSLLEEECSLGNGTDTSYMSKIEKSFGTGKKDENPYFRNNKKVPELFSVVHFAGPVEYCVTNFLEKNRDSLSQTSKDTMLASTVPLISTLFKMDELEGGEKDKIGKSSKKGTKSTLGGQFRKQLISLINILHETQPHFVRCVKPNHAKVPSEFDGQLSLRQLRYAGLFEAIKIRRSGYAFRSSISQFSFDYQHIVPGLLLKRQSKEVTDLESCRLIFNEVFKVEKLLPEDCGVIGKTKVFLKTNQQRSILDHLKSERIVLFVYRIQSLIRGGLTRFRLNAVKRAEQKELLRIEKEMQDKINSIIVLQKFMRGYIARRMMRDIADLILLRKSLLERDVTNVEKILEIIQKKVFSKSNPFSKLFKKDVDLAKSMIRLIGKSHFYIFMNFKIYFLFLNFTNILFL
jgi:myosin heavy subunit